MWGALGALRMPHYPEMRGRSADSHAQVLADDAFDRSANPNITETPFEADLLAEPHA